MTDRFKKYYTEFKTREIGELNITIAPLGSYIPKVKFVGTEATSGFFIILFDINGENVQSTYCDDSVEIFQGTNTDRISKIILKDIKKKGLIKRVDIDIYVKKLDKFEQEYLKKATNLPNLDDRLSKIGKYDIIDRQLDESKDFFSSLNS